MNIKSNDRVCIVGKTGSGKTMYFKKVLYPMYPRKIFHDIKNENTDVRHTALCRTPGELQKAINDNHMAILYQPRDISPADFNKVCQIVFNTGNIMLYVDEAAPLCSPSQIEDWHYELLIRGRSRGIGLVHSSQRPRAINNTIISESEHHFIFRLTLKTDRMKMREAVTDDIVDQIATLPPYYCIYSNIYEETQMLKPVRI